MFEELLKIIGDNEAGKNLVEKIKSQQEELSSKYNSMEVKFNEAVETRNKAKEKLNLVKTKFGLEEISDEALDGVKKGKADEQVIAEIENLKKALSQEVEAKKEIENSYKSKLQNMALDNAFANSGLVDIAANKETLSILKGLAKQGATFNDNEKIVFKNEDGSTALVDGRPMTIEDKIKQISSNEAYAGLFKPTTQGGAGTQNTAGTATPNNFSGLSATEMMKQGRK